MSMRLAIQIFQVHSEPLYIEHARSLKKFFPDEDYEFIKFTQDSYYWNVNIPYVKLILILKSCALFQSKSLILTKFDLCSEIFEIYNGDFLPNHTYIEFVLYRNTYFRNQYLQANHL